MTDRTPRVPTPEAIQKKWQGLFDALNHELPFICVITSASYVEHCVRALLRAKLVNGNTAQTLLDPVRGALGSIHNASAAAYAIGAISDGCRQNINRIADIRNLFAHGIDGISFSTKAVATICLELTPPGMTTVVADEGVPPSIMETNDPRGRFTIISSIVCSCLMVQALGAKHFDKCSEYWG